MRVDAEAAGLDAGALERIDEHLQARYIEPGKIAGAQVAIVRDGQVGYFRSFGMADLERQRAVDDGTIFRLYSMTKPIAGVALLQLYERGHFQLLDPISRHIKQWKDLKVKVRDQDGHELLVEPEREMTVRDVMMHTSGIGYTLTNEDLTPELVLQGTVPKGTTLSTMVDALAAAPLRFHPGSRWLYSLGMDICGYLVEKFSGQRFDEYLADHVFGPLGMTDTAFVVPDDKVDRFAANYVRNANKELVLLDDPERSRYRREPTLLSGGGGLVGTAADYLRFVQMLSHGGEVDGQRILSRPTLELMGTNHLPGNVGLDEMASPGSHVEVGFDGMGFGLTVAVGLDRAQSGLSATPGFTMWGGAASTTFWADPAERLGVVFMTQLMPSGTFNFGGQLRALVYGALAG